MAHFAQLDDNNMVTQVIVIHNNELMIDEVESEDKGILFCKALFGQDTKWKQTSYNGNKRKNYAGVGFTYDADMDAFVPPQPFASWTLNTDTAQWEAPIPAPTEGLWLWDESTQTWVTQSE